MAEPVPHGDKGSTFKATAVLKSGSEFPAKGFVDPEAAQAWARRFAYW